MKAKLYQISPYNITDNNFYNFTSQLKFNQFIDKIEKPMEKDVSIVKLEAYNKIMYKLKFENESEEKTFCGFKYMIVDNKYWFITNFDVKKNNNEGFITYYAQLDHWATQWLTVKKHIHNNIHEKSLYVERMHQNRWYYKNNILYLNFKKNSPFHQEEKIKINNYYPVKTYKIKTIDLIKDYEPKLTISNKCYYFLRLQLNKPLTFYNYCNIKPEGKSYSDFCYNYIFIPLTDENMHYYLSKFNPNYMNIFSVIDKKIELTNYEKYLKNEIDNNTQMKEYYDAIKKNNFEIRDNEYFLPDVTFYKLMNKNDSYVYDELDIKETDLKYDLKNNLIMRNYEEPILKCYPYTKYIYNKGNNFKEYKINELLYDENENEKIKMRYFSGIIYDIYSVWIFPITGIFKNIKEREFLPYSLNILINMEIPTTSNSYTTYAQNNLNTLQTNINQAETARQIANQEATVGLVTNSITTALGVALAPVSFGASLGLAGAGAAYMGLQTNKWINTQIKNNFEVDSLNAKISDMKNTPNLISAINNNYYWLTYFNNEYNTYDACKNYKKSNTSRFLVSSITPPEQKNLSDWYYYNGYLFNRYTNDLNFDEKRNRYILNFYKIKDIKTILASCPEICNEDIEWWNNTFQQGIIVWETEDPLNLYEQIYIGNNKYENWEIELLNIDYILQKIKADKIKQK